LVGPLGFDQSLKPGSGHRLTIEGHRFKSSPGFEPTSRMIARPAARNFPYDVAAETTIRALQA
jgi:hypothetical protein